MRGSARNIVDSVGPTWLAGAIAAGPATIASLITGSGFGYTLLWVVIASAILGATAQYLATRLSLLTGEGIVTLVETHLGSTWAWILVADAVLAAGLAQLVIMKTVADISAQVTGLDGRLWAVIWGVTLAVGLASGGYSLAENAAKVLVSVVVLAFVASVFVVPVDVSAASKGLIPQVPGISGALAAAGILGGGVHITLITMQSYTVQSRGWGKEDTDTAVLDIVTSMVGAFGIYSVSIFLVAATVIGTSGVSASGLTASAAAQALDPIAGEYAEWLFLLGLWGAAITTLGGNTVVPPYLLADKLGWDASVSDPRFRQAISIVGLAGIGGVFLQGAFLPLLVLVTAFGLVGTPFAIVLVLYLLNDPGVVPETNSVAENISGMLLIGVTTVTAGLFLRQQLSSGLGFLTVGVSAFALLLSLAMATLGFKYLLSRADSDRHTASS